LFERSKILVSTAHPASDTITFLGTGGARFMVATQSLASGGLWLNLDGTQILVDPGPGCIVQATRLKLNPEELSAIIASHRHLDHIADVNIMVDAMTRGGLKPQGRFFAPADALDSEPVIFKEYRDRLAECRVLSAGSEYSLGGVSFSTPVRHIHGVETYGLVFKTARYTIAYITDTHYFEALPKYYSADLLLLNVVFDRPVDARYFASLPSGHKGVRPQIDHLSVPDAERLIGEIRPSVAIMTHFGTSMWRARPSGIAERLSYTTGVRVIAAKDDMTFSLFGLGMAERAV
jgi:phosphoribosyl 1,2-cyclic phosphodiesterase